MMRRDILKMAAIGVIPWEQPRIDHRRWVFKMDGTLTVGNEAVGQWLQSVLPSPAPGRMRAGRYFVVQLVTADCHLMIASQAIPPLRERTELTVSCMELAGSKWFPLNGNATLVTGGDGPDELSVTLAEVV